VSFFFSASAHPAKRRTASEHIYSFGSQDQHIWELHYYDQADYRISCQMGANLSYLGDLALDYRIRPRSGQQQHDHGISQSV
jgi:hypothetical protein